MPRLHPLRRDFRIDIGRRVPQLRFVGRQSSVGIEQIRPARVALDKARPVGRRRIQHRGVRGRHSQDDLGHAFLRSAFRPHCSAIPARSAPFISPRRTLRRAYKGVSDLVGEKHDGYGRAAPRDRACYAPGAVRRISAGLAIRIWRRDGLGAPHGRRAAPLARRRRIRRNPRPVPVHAGTERPKPRGLYRHTTARRVRRPGRAGRFHRDPLGDRLRGRDRVSAICRDWRAARHSSRNFGRGRRSYHRHRPQAAAAPPPPAGFRAVRGARVSRSGLAQAAAVRRYAGACSLSIAIAGIERGQAR